MSADQIVAVVVGVLSVISGFVAAVGWLVRHYLSELKPNSGSSLNDRVTAIEHQVYRIYDLLLEERLGR